MMSQPKIHHLLLVSLLLLLELLLIVVLQLGCELFTLLVLDVHFSEIHLEFLKQAIDRCLILLLDLVDLPLVTLFHL